MPNCYATHAQNTALKEDARGRTRLETYNERVAGWSLSHSVDSIWLYGSFFHLFCLFKGTRLMSHFAHSRRCPPRGRSSCRAWRIPLSPSYQTGASSKSHYPTCRYCPGMFFSPKLVQCVFYRNVNYSCVSIIWSVFIYRKAQIHREMETVSAVSPLRKLSIQCEQNLNLVFFSRRETVLQSCLTWLFRRVPRLIFFFFFLKYMWWWWNA